jgi:hypothetical protein
MRYVARPPCAPLSDVVDYVWSLHDAPGHARTRIVPSGTVELVINLAEDEFRIYDATQLRTLPGAVGLLSHRVRHRHARARVDRQLVINPGGNADITLPE